MIRAIPILLLLATPASAKEPFCYRGGRLCDCVTHVCEGDNFRKPLPPGSTVTVKMHRDKHQHHSAQDIRDLIDTNYPPVDFSIGARM
jgi:hypothetical protein